MLNIKITPQRDALLRGFDNEFHALVQVKADENIAENKKENALNLAIVIDCSGSMQGKPLQEAKRSAMMMVDLMQSTDKVAIIAYDSSACLIVPSTFVLINKQLKHGYPP